MIYSSDKLHWKLEALVSWSGRSGLATLSQMTLKQFLSVECWPGMAYRFTNISALYQISVIGTGKSQDQWNVSDWQLVFMDGIRNLRSWLFINIQIWAYFFFRHLHLNPVLAWHGSGLATHLVRTGSQAFYADWILSWWHFQSSGISKVEDNISKQDASCQSRGN